MSRMTFHIIRQPEEFDGASIQIYSEAMWKSFQELVQRGSNLWPDAPPEIKEFADMVTSGRVMQDYYKQACIRRCVCGVVLKGGVTHMNCTAGVAERHPRCGYPYCACVGECFAASQPGVTAGVAPAQQANKEQPK